VAIPTGMTQVNNFQRQLPPDRMMQITQQPQLGGQQPAPAMQSMQGQSPTNTQQYGLAGAENAYNQGVQGAGQALQQGTNQSLGTLQGGYTSALNQLGQGQGALQQGAMGGVGAIQRGVNQGLGMIDQGQQALSGNFNSRAANVDPMTGQPMFQQAAEGVGQFAGAGLSAQQRQASLSGALGQEAQQQAFQQFNASPGQQYLQEQGMRQVLNANTATGGLGGGNVLQELQRQGQGLAQQDYQNQFANLGSLSNQGLQAAGQQGQFLSQAGQQQGQLAGQNAQMKTQVGMNNASNALNAANSRANLFGQGASMSANAGLNQGNILNQLGNNQANLFGSGANLAGQLSSQGANIQNSQGTNIANLLSGTAGNIAQGRMQAGRDIAGNVSNVSGALGGLANQQGQGLSDMTGQGSANIANLLSGYGNMTAQQQQQLAMTLSNMAVGEGSQQAGITQGVGQAQAGGAMQQGQNQQNLLGNLTQAVGYYQGNQAPQMTQPTGSNMVNNAFIANNQQPGFGRP
jgi:hypothetical protein